MSYSFDVTADTKDEAKALVASKLDEVIAQQPAHSQDRDAALATAAAFIDLLSDDDTKSIRVSVHGSVSWAHDPADPYGSNTPPLTNASVGVSAYHLAKA